MARPRLRRAFGGRRPGDRSTWRGEGVMRRFTRFGRWTARGLRVLALGAALAVPATLAHGQTAGSSPYAAPKKTYTKNLSFDLPILMDDATRAGLREVCLYVKTP